MRTELLLGCGRDRRKKIFLHEHQGWTNLVTIDHNKDIDPDIILDLNQIELPFKENQVDEIHAYEVLEHLSTQGDWRFFFNQFSEFWRILKPDGYFFASVPMPDSIWAWGDPSHTRVLPKENLMFLRQPNYAAVNDSPMSDFRFFYKADFDISLLKEKDGCLYFMLKAIKPSRISL